MDVERGDRFESAAFDALPFAQQVGWVGDEAGVFVRAEVAALGVEGGPVGRFVAPVAVRIEERYVDRLVGEVGVCGVADEQTVGL